MTVKLACRLFLIASVSAMGLNGAHAQESAAPAEGSGAGILDIVVTAQKRSAGLQDTPLAVSAMGGEELQKRQIADIENLAPALPNVNFGKNVGFARIAIRGLGLDATVAGQEGRVAYHTDGVYISRPTAQLATFFDIGRVEVVRGPQGTLYGRNATAGAINVITNEPESEFGGYARLTVGNYNLFAEEGAITGAVTDTIAARFAFVKTDRGGYGDNVLTGQEIDNEHSLGVRAKLKFEPSTDFKLVLSADYSQQDDANFVYHFLGQGSPSMPPRVVGLGGTVPSDPRDVTSDVPHRNNREFYGFSADLEYDFGPFSLTSVTGYRKSYTDYQGDHDGTNAPVSVIRLEEKSRQFSEELRIDGEIGNLRWLLGGFYFEESGFGRANFSPVLAFNNQYQTRGLLFDGSFDTKATAVFGQLDYELLDGLTLSAGLRYSHEKKSIDQRGMIDFATQFEQGFTPVYTLFQDEKATFSSTTPRFSLEYKIAPRILFYATYSKGFKSGGFNLTGFTPPVTPEKLTDYEAGIKSDWLNGDLRLNLAGFYYDYKDLQVQKVINTAAILVNAANARVKGVEAEFIIRPFHNFELSGNASWLDAKFTSFTTSDAARPELGELDLSGNRLPQAPKYTANLAAQYTHDLPAGELVLRGELSYTSRVYFSAFNRPEISQGGFAKGNMSLRYSGDNGLTGSLWVRNIADKRTVSTSQVSSGFLRFPIMGAFDPPRTYGASIGIRF